MDIYRRRHTKAAAVACSCSVEYGLDADHTTTTMISMVILVLTIAAAMVWVFADGKLFAVSKCVELNGQMCLTDGSPRYIKIPDRRLVGVNV